MVKTGNALRAFSRAPICTMGLMLSFFALLIRERSMTAFEPKPGTISGESVARTSAPAPIRRAVRPAEGSRRFRAPGELHTGPQLWIRRSESANRTESAASRNTTPYIGLWKASRTLSANAMSAIGGTRESSGLPARNASA